MGSLIDFQPLAQLNAIHFGHHDIADDQVRHFVDGSVQAVLAIHCFDDSIVAGETALQVALHISIVFDDQNDGIGFTMDDGTERSESWELSERSAIGKPSESSEAASSDLRLSEGLPAISSSFECSFPVADKL